MFTKHQFGKYDCAQKLSEMLNEPALRELGKKLATIYAEYRITQKEYEKLEDKRTFQVSHLLMRNYVLDTIDDVMRNSKQFKALLLVDDNPLADNWASFSKAISFFENVVRTDYKEALRKRGY